MHERDLTGRGDRVAASSLTPSSASASRSARGDPRTRSHPHRARCGEPLARGAQPQIDRFGHRRPAPPRARASTPELLCKRATYVVVSRSRRQLRHDHRGGGHHRSAVAREILSRRSSHRVLVVDREDATGAHQTGHNSGVIHAGVYYRPGSLKARLCVDGAARMYAYCEQRGLDVQRVGKLIIASRPQEIAALDELVAAPQPTALRNRRRRAQGLLEVEPHAVGIAALALTPHGIVDFRGLRKDGERRAALGGELRLRWNVEAVSTTARTVRCARSPATRARAARPCSAPAAVVRRRAAGGRRRGSPDRAVPAADTCACAPSAASSCGASSIRCPIPASVPRHPPHAAGRRRGAARSVGDARRRPRTATA